MLTVLGEKELALCGSRGSCMVERVSLSGCTVGNAGSRFGKKRKTREKKEKRKERRIGE